MSCSGSDVMFVHWVWCKCKIEECSWFGVFCRLPIMCTAATTYRISGVL